MKYSESVQCIDIGNTRTSIGSYENGIITKHTYIPTIDLIQKKAKILSPLLKYDIPVSYCSVVPSAEMELIKFADENYLKVFNLNINTVKKLPINYKFPDQIGQDRLANSLAVYLSHDLPCIVLDIGTATTFDVITENEGYVGGVIAPGPQGYLDFLHQNTALLPKLKYSNQNIKLKIGKSTTEAMHIGTSIGYPSMVRGILNEIISELEKFSDKPKIITTGGNQDILNHDNISCLPNLTLTGLALAFAQNN
jgi:type III pantothenate kinase